MIKECLLQSLELIAQYYKKSSGSKDKMQL